MQTLLSMRTRRRRAQPRGADHGGGGVNADGADRDLVHRLGRVAVVMGGWSAERDISLLSGRAVLAGLQECGVEAIGLDADRQILQRLGAGSKGLDCPQCGSTVLEKLFSTFASASSSSSTPRTTGDGGSACGTGFT